MNTDIFLKAALITGVLVLISIVVGNYIENAAYSKLNSDLLKISEDNEAVLIMQSFAGDNDTQVCGMIESQTDSMNGKIYNLRSELEAQKSTSILTNYDLIRREYFLANARLLSLTKLYARQCGGKDNVLLFFYTSEKECPECFAQGRIIDDVRARCGNLKVFSFPEDVDMSVIKSFMAYYKVSSSPSVVVDNSKFDVVLENVTGADDILRMLDCRNVSAVSNGSISANGTNESVIINATVPKP
jgi:hypothetical protein